MVLLPLLLEVNHLRQSCNSMHELELEIFRSSYQSCSIKKGILENFAKFTGKHLCQSLFFSKKETLAYVFCCGFCEISKNTLFTEHLWATASRYLILRAACLYKNIHMRCLTGFWTRFFVTIACYIIIIVKGTLMQIWKSTYMFVFIHK